MRQEDGGRFRRQYRLSDLASETVFDKAGNQVARLDDLTLTADGRVVSVTLTPISGGGSKVTVPSEKVRFKKERNGTVSLETDVVPSAAGWRARVAGPQMVPLLEKAGLSAAASGEMMVPGIQAGRNPRVVPVPGKAAFNRSRPSSRRGFKSQLGPRLARTQAALSRGPVLCPDANTFLPARPLRGLEAVAVASPPC